MHVSGFPFDLSALLQFVATAALLIFGLVHLVKSAASRYFVVAAKFDGVDSCRNRMTPDRSASAEADAACFVCSGPASKKCSRCKAVRYCSTTCQSKHWREDHKNNCKEMKLAAQADSTACGCSPSGKRTGTDNFSSSRGTYKELKRPLKALFPYDEFVKLFNWESPGFSPCGLLNCGNSCYANVVLQCLACTKPLVAYLLVKGHFRECNRNDWCFVCELQRHVQRVTLSLQPFSPLNILSRLPSLGGNLGYGQQEDAHEFMRFAIDMMQSVCLDAFGGEKSLDPSTQETTVIQHIFGGYLQSEVICTQCNKISHRYENMMDLTVEIQGDAASLEDCLKQFTVKEWLDGENMYKCDGCNEYVKAWKRLSIRLAPNILTIALKRFQSGRFGKLNKRVTFPEVLDLGPYMSEATKGTDLYSLYAVIVHVDMLNASFFGHYICYTKDFSGNWYRIDDCKVMKVELEEVLAQGAYMLLYSRVHVRQPCSKPLKLSDKENECHLQQTEIGMMQKETNASEPSALSSSTRCILSNSNNQCDGTESRVKPDPQIEVEEPVDMDLDNLAHGASTTEPKRILPTLEFSSMQSNEIRGTNHSCSQAVEDVASLAVANGGMPTSSEQSSTRMSSIEAVHLSISSNMDPGVQEINGTRNDSGGNSVPQSSTDSYSTDETIESLSSESSLASSSQERPKESNISFSHYTGPKPKQVDPAHNPQYSQNGVARSLADFDASEGLQSSKSGEELRPLFSAGFLNKPARKDKFVKLSSAQGEPMGASLQSNGFAEDSLPQHKANPILNEKMLRRRSLSQRNSADIF